MGVEPIMMLSYINVICENYGANNILSESVEVKDTLIKKKYDWAKDYICESCKARFFMCSICASNRYCNQFRLEWSG